MRRLCSITPAIIAFLAGCAAGGPAANGEAPATPPAGPAGSPFSDRRMGLEAPLLIDRTDLRIGTTVHYGRIPTVTELLDLNLVTGLAHVVIALDEWPEGFSPIQHLGRTPPEADVIVVLRGYPPDRVAAEAWNLVGGRLRVIVFAEGPPPSNAVVADLNAMRPLERVIVEMDQPSRLGFERLLRPVSFRKVIP